MVLGGSKGGLFGTLNTDYSPMVSPEVWGDQGVNWWLSHIMAVGALLGGYHSWDTASSCIYNVAARTRAFNAPPPPFPLASFDRHADAPLSRLCCCVQAAAACMGRLAEMAARHLCMHPTPSLFPFL